MPLSNSPRFHRLAVSDVRRETKDAVSVGFIVPETLAAAYKFVPGQYLTLRATIDGEEVRRSYSICSAPQDETLRIAVKRVEDGVFSSWLNAGIKPGDTLDVMTPTGRFGLFYPAGDDRTYAGFAAGSGITPMLSILRGVLAQEGNSRFFLFYGNRTTSEIMFLEELADLKDRFLGRIAIQHVLSREEQDIPALNGRLDHAKVKLLLSTMLPVSAIDEAFICGPEGMIEEVETALQDLGLARDKIHVERFVSAYSGEPRPKAVIKSGAPPAHQATLIYDGKRREVPVAEGETILEAALRAGLDLPFACKGGMCSTCRAKVLKGTARMDINYSLESWELDNGFVLTCQAHPTTARVVVDYDQL
jgi:ring-1,2-phenylacetyl-CoA epoxidase subunit PaaE